MATPSTSTMSTTTNNEQLLLTLHKEIKALTRAVRKIQTKLDDPTGEKAALRSKRNGFNLPVMISAELAGLLGMDPADPISRASVTQKISAYVKEKGLQSAEDGRVIEVERDEPLAAVLKVPEGKKVSFTSLQTYLKTHYIKADAPVEEPTEEPAVDESSPTSLVPESEASAPPTPIKKKATAVKKRPTVRKPVSATGEAGC